MEKSIKKNLIISIVLGVLGGLVATVGFGISFFLPTLSFGNGLFIASLVLAGLMYVLEIVFIIKYQKGKTKEDIYTAFIPILTGMCLMVFLFCLCLYGCFGFNYDSIGAVAPIIFFALGLFILGAIFVILLIVFIIMLVKYKKKQKESAPEIKGDNQA